MNHNLFYHRLNAGVECFTAGQNSRLPYPVTQPHQIHKDTIAHVSQPGMTRDDLAGVDALITNQPNLPIAVRTADCIPILLYDPLHHAIAAIHSGWRGTILNIVAKTIASLHNHFASNSADIYALVGPGIGFDSFQVGNEVVDEFEQAGFPMSEIWNYRGQPIKGTMSGGHHINLKACVHHSLLQAGISSNNIIVSPEDTYLDHRFYSARRDGPQCGRNINAIKLL